MEFRDYYKTLGVARSASDAEIKSAYRKLARKHHPDVNPGNKQAEQRFKEINEAYQVLGDSAKRKKYDELGADWERGATEEEMRRQYGWPGAGATGPRGAGGFGGAAGGGGGFSDFFEQFFGGFGTTRGFGGGRAPRGFSGYEFTQGPRRGQDTEASVEVPLRNAASGTKMRISLAAEDQCPRCHGSGMLAQEERRGKTRFVRSAAACPACGGRGAIGARRSLEVTIPSGVVDGTRMRLKGQGGKGSRPELNGDLYLTVRLAPDRVFTVNGRDLRCELPVWDYEAALGAEVTAPTLDGRISLTIPPGSQSGRVMRLRGRGLPGRGADQAGDLLYELKVLAPTDLTDDERRLMRDLAERRKARAVPDPRADLIRG